MAFFGALTSFLRTLIVERDADGTFVTEEIGPTATGSNTTIYAAINMISQSIASLNMYIAEKKGVEDVYYTGLPDHPINALLKFPSPYINGTLFWEATARELLAKGNIYFWIRRSANGNAVSLWPGQAQLRLGGRDYEFFPWPLDGQYRRMILSRSNLLGIHGPGFNGVRSPSPIEAAADISKTVTEAQKYQLQRFKTGVHGESVIETDPTLEGVTAKILKKNAALISSVYNMARQQGKIPILLPGYKISTVGGVSAADLQIVELLRWGVEDLARVWNINPILLGSTRGSRQPLRELVEQYTRWTLRPPVQRIQAVLTHRLLQRQDQVKNYEVLFDLDRARLGTFRDQVETVELAVTRGGLLTLNEGRGMLGRAPMEGGDVLLIPKGSPSDPINPTGDPDDPDSGEDPDDPNTDPTEEEEAEDRA